MSGGHFEYAQYHIGDIYGREINEDDIDWYIKEHYLDEREIDYIRKHHRTLPNKSEFSEKTIAEFKKGRAYPQTGRDIRPAHRLAAEW